MKGNKRPLSADRIKSYEYYGVDLKFPVGPAKKAIGRICVKLFRNNSKIINPEEGS